MMNEKLDLTQKLGDAFLGAAEGSAGGDPASARQGAGGRAISSRARSRPSRRRRKRGTTVIKIEPATRGRLRADLQPDGGVRCRGRIRPTRRTAYYPPGYVPGAALFAFGVGLAVGAALWGNCNWGGGNVNVNVNKYNNFNRTNIQNGNWQHNAEHRKGVQYRDPGEPAEIRQGPARRARLRASSSAAAPSRAARTSRGAAPTGSRAAVIAAASVTEAASVIAAASATEAAPVIAAASATEAVSAIAAASATEAARAIAAASGDRGGVGDRGGGGAGDRGGGGGLQRHGPAAGQARSTAAAVVARQTRDHSSRGASSRASAGGHGGGARAGGGGGGGRGGGGGGGRRMAVGRQSQCRNCADETTDH